MPSRVARRPQPPPPHFLTRRFANDVRGSIRLAQRVAGAGRDPAAVRNCRPERTRRGGETGGGEGEKAQGGIDWGALALYDLDAAGGALDGGGEELPPDRRGAD
eukprot:gene47389-31382_t